MKNTTLQSLNWSKERIDETRKQSDKVRDLCSLAEKLGCNPTQLSIAWTLKHEPVQCLLVGATTVEQLHQNLQALQVKKKHLPHVVFYQIVSCSQQLTIALLFFPSCCRGYRRV